MKKKGTRWWGDLFRDRAGKRQRWDVNQGGLSSEFPFETQWTMIVRMTWLFMERHNLYWAWETQAAGQKPFLGSTLVFDLTEDHFQSSQQCRDPVLWSSWWSSGKSMCSTWWVPTCSSVAESAVKPQGSGVCVDLGGSVLCLTLLTTRIHCCKLGPQSPLESLTGIVFYRESQFFGLSCTSSPCLSPPLLSLSWISVNSLAFSLLAQTRDVGVLLMTSSSPHPTHYQVHHLYAFHPFIYFPLLVLFGLPFCCTLELHPSIHHPLNKIFF